MSIIELTEEERDLILARREEGERAKIIREILDILHLKNNVPNLEPFGNVCDNLCIETLRGLLAGVKSRPQRKIGRNYYYDD